MREISENSKYKWIIGRILFNKDLNIYYSFFHKDYQSLGHFAICVYLLFLQLFMLE
jgi:hypothetical protein